MSRMKFNESGRLVGIDSSRTLDTFEVNSKILDLEELEVEEVKSLKTSDSLDFLKQHNREDSSKDTEFWSLYDKGKKLEPLRFSNGKTQEDVVREIVTNIRDGKKVILVNGACGTGKSAIALNVARALGRGTIVVPVKNLQRQYEEDYTDRKYLLKKDGTRLSIAMLTGRENHDSIIKPGVSCADTTLPENIPISDKYFQQVLEYYKENPFVKHKAELDSVSKLTRIAIAPANPYWSPILPAEVDLQLKDAKKKKYLGLNNREFVIYQRQKGCSYYDQYQAYLDADVLVLNAAKYKIECALDRKPKTAVDIIDEGDEFLDSFSAQYTINVNKLINALKLLYAEDDTQSAIDKILLNLNIEEKRVRALGVNEEKVFHIKETNFESILRTLGNTKGIEVEVSMDDLSYVHKGLEAAKQFSDSLDETHLTYRMDNHELLVTFVTTNVAKKFNELVEKSGAMVLLSGTLHSARVLKEVFGIKDFVFIDAEKANQGNLEIHRTGKEIDCRYENFKTGKHTREEYLRALNTIVGAAKKPTLIHVNAFEDLPSEIEIRQFELSNLISKEQLRLTQNKDRNGEHVRKFKDGHIDRLFSTRCTRGVDFPGNQCNSIVFTKYPNPDMRNTFWKILQQTHKNYFWDVYKDKAWREFLQRIYRALRSKDDHVYLLSPDKRVLDSARTFQLS